VDFGVSSIPKRVETTSPWSNDPRDSKENQSAKSNHEDGKDETPEKSSELFAWHASTDKFNESDQLEKTKNAYFLQ
jgi:hypothetical protein